MFKLLRDRIGMIGYGNMGQAIARQLRSRYRIIVFDKDESKFADPSGSHIAKNIAQLLAQADAVILAVKPQDFEALLSQTKGKITRHLVISIAAGITTKYIENALGRARVIRVMPNIGAIVGQSISYICKGEFANNRDLRLSNRLFRLIGHTFHLSEELMNAATAVGGSGPGFWGYLFDKQPREKWNEYKSNYFIPELTLAAESIGLDEKTARLTAKFVTTASISAAEALHITPAELTDKVASKGGTTEAGLEVLRNRGSLTDAVKAAFKRAEELSRG